MSITIDGDNISVALETTNVNVTVGDAPVFEGGGGGVTDHGALTGLTDDDHTQYHNDARGDARYSQLGHAHAIADVTGLQTALDGKQASGSYAAATHSHIIADVTGLQTALDGKAATSHSHIISDITSLQTSLNNATRHPQWAILNGLGAATKFTALGLTRSQITSTIALTDGQLRIIAVQVDYATTINGVTIYQVQQGHFVGDNFNGLALSSYLNGVLTDVAVTANSEAIWKNAANTFASIPFTSPYSAAAGTFFIKLLYNSSSQTTQPTIGGFTATTHTGINDYTNSAKLSGFLAAQTAFVSPQNISAIGATTGYPFIELY